MLGPPGNDTKRRIPDDGGANETSRLEPADLDDRRRVKAAGAGSRRPDPRVTPAARHWTSRPGRLGVFTIFAAALLGCAVTALSGRDPGLTLGVFVIVGTVVAATIVKLRAVYMIFPVPALAYVATAVIAGVIHDRATDASTTGLALNALQWIAAGFVAMLTATILAIVIAACRWLSRYWWISRT
jgi:hypothetical protein